MRLKTKIILICSLVVIFVSVVCSTTAFLTMRAGYLDTAIGQSFQMAVDCFSDIENKIVKLRLDREKMDNTVMEYIMKDTVTRTRTGMLVCFYIDDAGEKIDIYNDTVLESSDLEKIDYQNVSDHLEQAELKWKKQHFVVYRSQNYDYFGYQIYMLADITYVRERINLIGLALVLLTFFLTVLAYVILSVMMNKVLSPLQELNVSAKQIACGNYDQRVMVKQRDEIGELSDNFNQMAEAVEIRTHSLEESEKRKTLFMSNLTHELKTPLTAISGYAKTLLTVKLPDEDKEEALSFIYEESCRLERLSKKMINLLLLEKEEEIVRSQISAKELFSNAQAVCSGKLAEAHIELEYHENGEFFLVDKDLFVEVLVNLIDNAIKASEQGNRILLTASDHSIIVQDFGKGIPEEEREKILEPFYMIDKSRSRKSGGAGLGLAITAMILKRHECQLKIESTVGKGTRIILQFV
ncbi:MAG: HAMP domain-containing histidine kinase [Lachnospiraceae bacterium]|nr:HAMP domain-containing histidine kinase [Lachnospiraceae bacterium]